jgi:hypothetical protein
MSRIIGGLCTLFLIVVFTPALAQADPIVVTSGTITVSGLAGGPHFTLVGNNFFAMNAGGDTGNFAPQLSCTPCIAGTTLGVSGTFLGSSLGGGGTATINGTTFTNAGYSGVFHLGGNSFVVPSVLTNVSVTVPFTFVGTLNGCSGSCLINPTIFSVDLVGSGTATVLLNFIGFDNLGRPLFFFNNATFQFEVPEPASILLFGGGLTLLAAKVRRRFVRSE